MQHIRMCIPLPHNGTEPAGSAGPVKVPIKAKTTVLFVSVPINHSSIYGFKFDHKKMDSELGLKLKLCELKCDFDVSSADV